MKETKRQFNNFQIMEFEKIEKHLKKMAEKGWMLESIEGILWKYKKIEPKSLHFSVAFFPKAKAFEPGPSEEQQMMWEFCEKTGWILAAQNMQLQIFYNEAENPVPIETDATIQVENIHKTAKSNVLSTWGMFTILAILQLGVQSFTFWMNPIQWLASNIHIFNIFIFLLIFIHGVIQILSYLKWYRRARKTAQEDGYFVSYKVPRILTGLYVMAMIILLVFSILSIGETIGIPYAVAIFSGIILLIIGVCKFSGFLKKKKISAGTNILVTILLTIGICVVCIIAIVVITLSSLEDFENEKAELPLYVEDMIEIEAEDITCDIYINRSVFITHQDVSQWKGYDEELGGTITLDYEIVDVKFPFLYDICKDAYLTRYERLYGDEPDDYKIKFMEQNSDIWGSNEVYREYTVADGFYNTFIVCYEERIITIHFSWEPTDEQIGIVREKLGEK